MATPAVAGPNAASGSGMVKMLSLVLGGLVLIAGAGAGGWFVAKQASSSPPVEPQPSPEPPESLSAKEIEKLEEEIAELKKQKTGLEQDLTEQNGELKKKQQEIKDAEQRLQDLLSMHERLSKWQTADLIVGNQDYGAIAFQTDVDTGRYQFVDLATNPKVVPAAILAGANSRATWLPADRKLYNNFERNYEPGRIIEVSEFEHLSSQLRRATLISNPLASEAPFITYRLQTESHPRFCRFVGIEDGMIRVQALGQQPEILQLQDIADGSARLIQREEIDYLDDGEFLDACLLEAIQRLQEDASTGAPPSLAIQVRVSQGGMRSSSGGYFYSQLCRKRAQVADLGRAAYLLEADVYDRLVGLEKLDTGLTILAPGSLDRVLEQAIYPRLVGAGLLLMLGGADYADVIAQWTVDSVDDYEREMGLSQASHLLTLEVAPPAEGGAYFLKVGLRNLRTREALFAAAGDRFFSTRSHLHFPASGKLALMRGKQGALPAEFLHEPNNVLWRGSLFRKAPNSTSGVVLLEGNTPSTYIYRTLLGSKLEYAIKKDVECTPIQEDYMDSAPLPDRIRIAAHKIVRSCLPPSGIVARVSEDGNSALITIGASANLKVGDRLSLARPREMPGGERMTYELATPLVVNKVSANSAEVAFVPTGLEELLEHSDLQRGDIVFAKSRNLPIVVIEPFQFEGVADQRIASKVRWNIPVRRTRLTTQANDATKMLHERIMNAVRTMSVPSVSYKNLGRNHSLQSTDSVESYGTFLPPNARVTHLIGGRVKVVSDDDCQFDFDIRDPSSNQLLSRFAITLDVGRN